MSGDHVERLRAWRAFAGQNRPGYDHMADVSYGGAPACDADVDAALDELEQLRADNAVLLDGNQRLQIMNEGLRRMAIEAREAAEDWHRATIDLYSGRTEPCPCGCRPEFTDCGCGMSCECAGRCPVCDVSAAEEQQTAPEPELTKRQAQLLAAIRREGGDFSPLRARTALVDAGANVTSERAHQIMKQLADRGYLKQVRPRAYTYRLKAEAPQQPENGGGAPC